MKMVLMHLIPELEEQNIMLRALSFVQARTPYILRQFPSHVSFL